MTALVGRWGHQGHGPLPLGRDRLCFVFLRKKMGFPRFFGGPLWLSSSVAPEHLRGYPLGLRRC
jgi:hypothetical protein